MCRARWMGDDVATRFVHIIAHEMAHVQQPASQVETPGATVLFQALLEGGADFVAELTSGDTINPQLLIASPYLCALLAMCFFSKRTRQPAAAGAVGLCVGLGARRAVRVRPGDADEVEVFRLDSALELVGLATLVVGPEAVPCYDGLRRH